MIPVADILTRVSLVMHDQDFIRWTKPEWLAWINDAVKEIAVLRPAVSAATQPLTLVAGVLQSLPADSQLLIDITRNLPSGRGITLTDRSRLEEAAPYWYGLPNADQIRHYCYDDRNPQSFYVYPPAEAGVQLEVVVSLVPSAVTSEGDSAPLGGEYIGPVVSYCLYRAHSKDSEYANGQLAVLHHQAFASAMGISNQTKLVDSPTRAAP